MREGDNGEGEEGMGGGIVHFMLSGEGFRFSN